MWTKCEYTGKGLHFKSYSLTDSVPAKLNPDSNETIVEYDVTKDVTHVTEISPKLYSRKIGKSPSESKLIILEESEGDIFDESALLIEKQANSESKLKVIKENKRLIHTNSVGQKTSKCKYHFFCVDVITIYINNRFLKFYLIWCWFSSGTKHMKNTKEIPENTKEIGPFFIF